MYKRVKIEIGMKFIATGFYSMVKGEVYQVTERNGEVIKVRPVKNNGNMALWKSLNIDEFTESFVVCINHKYCYV